MFGLELLLIPLGNAVLGLLTTAGIGGLTGVSALTVGGLTAGAGAGAAAAGALTAGSTANPMVAGGYEAAAIDAYNNAVTGSSEFINGLDLPFFPPLNAN